MNTINKLLNKKTDLRERLAQRQSIWKSLEIVNQELHADGMDEDENTELSLQLDVFEATIREEKAACSSEKRLQHDELMDLRTIPDSSPIIRFFCCNHC